MKKQFSTVHLVVLALFATLALSIHTAEAMLPSITPIPGIKLGLANVITLILLIHMKPRDAGIVLLLRITLASIFSGNLINCFYSFAGGLVAFAVMTMLHHLFAKRFVILTAIAGALAHNLSQILLATLLTGTPVILAYTPILIIAGAICGVFTGCAAHFSKPLLNRLFASVKAKTS